MIFAPRFDPKPLTYVSSIPANEQRRAAIVAPERAVIPKTSPSTGAPCRVVPAGGIGREGIPPMSRSPGPCVRRSRGGDEGSGQAARRGGGGRSAARNQEEGLSHVGDSSRGVRRLVRTCRESATRFSPLGECFDDGTILVSLRERAPHRNFLLLRQPITTNQADIFRHRSRHVVFVFPSRSLSCVQAFGAR